MKEKAPFSWQARARSFKYAAKGLRALWSEHNTRIHTVCALLAVIAGALLGLSPLEWVAIILCIGVVLAAEAINTAIEALADQISTDTHPLLGRAKDTAAAAVLILAAAALLTALIIYLPKLRALL